MRRIHGQHLQFLTISKNSSPQMSWNCWISTTYCQSWSQQTACTDRLQPLDLRVNKVAKAFLQREFQEWYANEISNNMDEDGILKQPVDLSTSRMKCIGVSWLVRLHEYLVDNPQHVINGFRAAGTPQSVDAGRPNQHEEAINYEDEYTDDDDCEDDNDCDDDDCDDNGDGDNDDDCDDIDDCDNDNDL